MRLMPRCRIPDHRPWSLVPLAPHMLSNLYIESDDLEAKLTYYKGLFEKWLLDREVWVKKQEQLLGLDK